MQVTEEAKRPLIQDLLNHDVSLRWQIGASFDIMLNSPLSSSLQTFDVKLALTQPMGFFQQNHCFVDYSLGL